jgi:hypothetical protein
MAQGSEHHEPKPSAFLSLDDGPTRPGFGPASPGWLTALGQAQHITNTKVSVELWSLPHVRSDVLQVDPHPSKTIVISQLKFQRERRPNAIKSNIELPHNIHKMRRACPNSPS